MHTITWKKARQSNICQRRSGLCNLCHEEKVEILLSQAKPPTQLNRRFEVSTCRHESPPTSIAPTSKLIKTESNRPLHLSEDHSRCCCQLISSIAKLRCFAVSAGAIHSDSTVSEVGIEGSRKGDGYHEGNDHSRGNGCAQSGRFS